MRPSQLYSFLRQHGIPLFDEYGKDDYVLDISFASLFIEMAENEFIPIIGGDVYLKKGSKLLFGDYYWLSWSCERQVGEDFDQKSYFDRSIKMAKEQLVKIETVMRRRNIVKKIMHKEAIALYINFAILNEVL